jgi:single-strand DNA-binding protein
MQMSDVQVMLYGYVGQDVSLKQAGSVDVASFRVGTTPRIRDGQGGYRNGETVWTSVTCWRHLARNVKESVHVGDPVVVLGRARTERWVTPDGEQRERQFVEATTVCHDLAKGTSVFRKSPRNPRVQDGHSALGAVLDEAEQTPVGIDPVTGEPLYLPGGVERTTGRAADGESDEPGTPGEADHRAA